MEISGQGFRTALLESLLLIPSGPSKLGHCIFGGFCSTFLRNPHDPRLDPPTLARLALIVSAVEGDECAYYALDVTAKKGLEAMALRVEGKQVVKQADRSVQGGK